MLIPPNELACAAHSRLFWCASVLLARFCASFLGTVVILERSKLFPESSPWKNHQLSVGEAVGIPYPGLLGLHHPLTVTPSAIRGLHQASGDVICPMPNVGDCAFSMPHSAFASLPEPWGR